ncbi:unnamed protein product, partial [Schistosoma turkestanicum]
ISHEIGGQLVKYSARDACPLVRCMVVEAFRGLVKQFEIQLCAIGIQYLQEISMKQIHQCSSNQQYCKKLSMYSIPPTTSSSTSASASSGSAFNVKRPIRHSTISVVTPPGGANNNNNSNNNTVVTAYSTRPSESTSNHTNLHGSWSLIKSSNREIDQQQQHNYSSYSYYKTQPQASPVLRKSVFNPGSVFFTGSGNTPSTNIYVQFWLTLIQLAQDPYLEISRLATILLQYLYGKIREKPEFQAIYCNLSNNTTNNSNNNSSSSNSNSHVNIHEETTSISPSNKTSFTCNHLSGDHQHTVNKLNSPPDQNNSQTTTTTTSSSSSIITSSRSEQ